MMQIYWHLVGEYMKQTLDKIEITETAAAAGYFGKRYKILHITQPTGNCISR